MPFAGVDPKWFTAAFISLVLIVVGGFVVAVASDDTPEAKTELRSMGFVLVNTQGISGSPAYVSLPSATSSCRLKLYRRNKIWRLLKPSFTDDGSVVKNAAQVRKLPEVIGWCGLPKQ